jgi:septal ring factor EnvC (AmiA/AmiB activator)
MSTDSSSKRQKTVIGLLIALILVLGFFAVNRNSAVENLEEEKAILVSELEEYKRDLIGQVAANDSMNSYIIAETARLNAAIEEITNLKNASQSELAKYRSQVNDLRKEVARLTSQIDSVNKAYALLGAAKEEVDAQLTDAQAKNADLSNQNSNLSGKVAEALKLQLSALEATAVRVSGKGLEKPTTSAGRANRIKACFTVAQNAIAEPSKRTVYMRINTPDGRVLPSQSDDRSMKVGNEIIYFSAKSEIMYEGKQVQSCAAFDLSTTLQAGTYTVEVFSDNAKIGTSTLVLN